MKGMAMDIFTRKHLGAWLIGLLVVMNLATLGTLWYTALRKPAAAPPPAGDTPRANTSPVENRRAGNRQADIRRFLERELDPSPEQAAQFEELRLKQAAAIQAAQEEIHRLKKAEIDAILAPQPDRAKGEALADQIGIMEAKKEQILFAHLRNLMALCRPDQEQKFRSILGELVRMFSPPGQPKPPGEKPPRRNADDPRDDPPPRDRR
jgi:Spy/CpxP family protein refolding chaperone